MPLEIGDVGQDAEAGRAVGLVGPGDGDGSKSARMTLAEGLAFLTSAISWIGPGPARAARKSRTGGASAAWASSSSSGIRLRAGGDLAPLRGDDLVEMVMPRTQGRIRPAAGTAMPGRMPDDSGYSILRTTILARRPRPLCGMPSRGMRPGDDTIVSE